MSTSASSVGAESGAAQPFADDASGLLDALFVDRVRLSATDITDDDALPRGRHGVTVVDAYAALNVAYSTDGASIRVDDGAAIESPIHVVDVAIPGRSANTSSSAVVIRLGAGSSATVVETRIGVGTSSGGSNVHTRLVLADDATLEHILAEISRLELLVDGL